MTAARGLHDRPDLDQRQHELPLIVYGTLPKGEPLLAYSARLAILNSIGNCSARVSAGAFPPGTVVSVDNTTKEVVIAWPAFLPSAIPVFNGNFEQGDVGWDKGPGWQILAGDNPMGGSWNAKNSATWGESYLRSTARARFTPGRPINAQCRVRQGASSAGNAGAAVHLDFYNLAGDLVATREGNMVSSASNNDEFPSIIAALEPPPGAAEVVMGCRMFRTRQNLPLWVDDLQWDVQGSGVGTNVEATYCATIEVRDAGGRLATWSGCVLVQNLTWDYITWSGPFAYTPAGTNIGQAVWDSFNGQYLVCFGPGIKRSPDGQNWTEITTGSNFYNVAANPSNGRIVAGDSNGWMGYSTDAGASFTYPQQLAGLATESLGFGNNEFVCINSSALASGGANGTSWSNGTSFPATVSGLRKWVWVAHLGVYMVARTNLSGTMDYATVPAFNGTYTVPAPLTGISGSAGCLHYSPLTQRVYMGTSNGQIWSSDDLVNWTLRMSQGGSIINHFVDIPALGSVVAVSNGNSTSTHRSTDGGNTWVSTTGLNSNRALAWSPTLRRLLAAGNTNAYTAVS